MIAEHYSYIEALKNGEARLLQQRLHDNLALRIEGISKDSDYYAL